jgi:hypothetical protein
VNHSLLVAASCLMGVAAWASQPIPWDDTFKLRVGETHHASDGFWVTFVEVKDVRCPISTVTSISGGRVYVELLVGEDDFSQEITLSLGGHPNSLKIFDRLIQLVRLELYPDGTKIEECVATILVIPATAGADEDAPKQTVPQE